MKTIKIRLLKNQRGLTLIELLAVIVILGIIAAIAIPSIGGIINKTKNDAKVAEGIQIINSAKMYASTHKIDSSKEVTNDELGDYLDNVKDTGFTVTITKDTTSGGTGKYSYTLEDHSSVELADKDAAGANGNGVATEEELLGY